jgi:hypothetical protein
VTYSFCSFLAWLVVAATASFLGWWGASAIGLRRGLWPVVGVLSCSAACAGLILFSVSWRPAVAVVKITDPPAFSMTGGYRLRVKGTVSPSAARVTLVVRSEKAIDWWVQQTASVDSNEARGTWTIDAFLGTPSQGSFQSFQVIALASPNPWLLDLLSGRCLMAGQRSKKVPDWSQSDPIVVRRNQ